MSQRIRIGLIGLNFGRHIVPALTAGAGREYLDLVTVCDANRDRALAVAAASGRKPSFDMDEVLADPSIDAVGLFTGPVGRASLIRKIIRSGKHVVTTKPFEIDPDAAEDVLNEARKLGKVVHMNSPAPVLPPDLRQVRDWQNQFDLGRPIACRRDVWASYREQPDGSWQDDPKQCPVAPIFRLGIYLINDMVRLLGDVEAVQVTQSRLFTGRPTADNAQLTLQFKSGAIGSIFASFCVGDGQPYRNSMVLNFARGTIYQNTCPGGGERGSQTAAMSLVTSGGENGPTVYKASPSAVSGGYQWDAFYRAVRGEALPDEVTVAQIVSGLQVIRAMNRASETGTLTRV